MNFVSYSCLSDHSTVFCLMAITQKVLTGWYSHLLCTTDVREGETNEVLSIMKDYLMLKAEMLAKQCDEDPMPIGAQYLPEWMTTPEAIEKAAVHVSLFIEMLDGDRDVIFMCPNEALANRMKKAYPECEIRFVREMDKNKIVVTKKKHLRKRGKWHE